MTHLSVQLQHADVVVDHGAVVARVHDDGAHGAALAVGTRVVQVGEPQHHLPQVSALPPAHARTHTHTQDCAPSWTDPAQQRLSPLEAVGDGQGPAAANQDAATHVAALSALQRALPWPRPLARHPPSQDPPVPGTVAAQRRTPATVCRTQAGQRSGSVEPEVVGSMPASVGEGLPARPRLPWQQRGGRDRWTYLLRSSAGTPSSQSDTRGCRHTTASAHGAKPRPPATGPLPALLQPGLQRRSVPAPPLGMNVEPAAPAGAAGLLGYRGEGGGTSAQRQTGRGRGGPEAVGGASRALPSAQLGAGERAQSRGPLVSTHLVGRRRAEHRQRPLLVGERHCRRERARGQEWAGLCVRACVRALPQSHSSEASEQCFLPSHHSVLWTHWWLLQGSSLSLHAAAQTQAQSATSCPDRKEARGHSQQLASSASRGQSGKPSQIMLALMQARLPGHSHRARSAQPGGHTGEPG